MCEYINDIRYVEVHIHFIFMSRFHFHFASLIYFYIVSRHRNSNASNTYIACCYIYSPFNDVTNGLGPEPIIRNRFRKSQWNYRYTGISMC